MLIMGLIRDVRLMLFVGRHFTVFLKEGLLVGQVLSKLIAGLGFKLLTLHCLGMGGVYVNQGFEIFLRL
jgi:hypothetical protein